VAGGIGGGGGGYDKYSRVTRIFSNANLTFAQFVFAFAKGDIIMKTSYKMPEMIQKYYRAWINGRTLLEDYADRERFYKFIKACRRYARQNIDVEWLHYFLERDMRKGYNERYRDESINKILVLFSHILEFNKTIFPDYIIEMKNPYLVYGSLRSYGYSDDKTEKILRDNFGASWREKYGL